MWFSISFYGRSHSSREDFEGVWIASLVKALKFLLFLFSFLKKMFLFPHIHTTRDGGGRKSFRGQILIILFQIEAKKEIYLNSSLNDSFYAMEIVFKSDKILFAICGCVCMVRLTRDMSHRYIFREFILI